MKGFYITTPLYYVNDEPHIGHAYTTVIADVLARYHRLLGDDTLFLVGTDEHGQKIAQSAKAAGVSPKEYADQYVQRFEQTWERLGISYDIFYRTTDPSHIKIVQQSLQTLWDKGEIYSKEYEGWYCVADEMYYTEKDLVDGLSPTGRPVEKIKELNYFFKMSSYQDRLIQHIETHPDFVRPDFRKNEVLGFLRKPLQDLSISRPKKRLSWGIELPFDKDHVTYVWFDALINYAAAVGFGDPKRGEEMERWWNPETGAGALHLIGKDILNTHSVYWPTMLMALGAPLPKIFAHGWWLTESNEKMSKSQGTVVRPLDLMEVIGVDPMRYFLVREMKLGNDAQFSLPLAVQRYNTDLSNTFGNLVSRTTTLIAKYFGGAWPQVTSQQPSTQALEKRALELAPAIEKSVRDTHPEVALELVIQLLYETNRYLEDHAPWKTAKEDPAVAAEPLRAAVEVARISALALLPVMPQKSLEILKSLGASESAEWQRLSTWMSEEQAAPIEKVAPLFPRVAVDATS